MTSLTELRAEFERPTAHSHFNEQVYGSMTDFDRTKRFHTVMGLQVNHEPIIPTVEERILRAKLLLEETIETIEKGLGLELIVRPRWSARGDDCIAIVTLDHDDDYPTEGELDVRHPEGRFYDAVETLDGLADVKVIAEGTAVAFGLPLEEASYEVYCSNMTKLDGNGNPIVNLPDAQGNLIDPSKPRGKLLKSEFYVPANIARVIYESVHPDSRNRVRGVLESNRRK